MNRFGEISLAILVVAVAGQVYGDVETSTICSLSFYRYLFNLPGEKVRPNVPEGTYVFGQRVGPASPEGQASNVQPAVLKPAPSYEAPLYLPPPSTTTTTTTPTTTTPKPPSTSAPAYIPPISPYYPAEASNPVQSAVLPPAKPTCDHPEHRKPAAVDGALLPPYRFDPSPKYQPQPTFFVPRFVPRPQTQVKQAASAENEVYSSPPQKPAFGPRYPVPTPPPQFLRPFVSSTVAAPAPTVHENCEKHYHPVPTATTTTTTTPPPPTTPEASVETRQNEISIVPEAASPQHEVADCGHKQHNVVIESVGVPSTDYGVVETPAPAPSAGYSYDKPSVPLVYPAANTVNGYTYPKPSPSFEYPNGYVAQGTSLFESEASKSSDDGDLVILKV